MGIMQVTTRRTPDGLHVDPDADIHSSRDSAEMSNQRVNDVWTEVKRNTYITLLTGHNIVW